ncbi:MAG: hypothetical protein ACC662_07325, partial [Planctomycetota bacterium]
MLSLAGHGAALAALVLFARPRPAFDEDPRFLTIAAPEMERDEATPVPRLPATASAPEVVDPAPAARPTAPLAGPVDEDVVAGWALPPLPARRGGDDVPWVRVDLPLSVV